MGTTERREREKEQRRNEIINSAERVFFSKGIENSTMDEIAEDAELSKGTLYLYFKSKEELFHAICGRAGKKLLGMFEESIKDKKSGLLKVKSIGQAFYDFSQIYPEYYEVIKRADSMKVCDCENLHEAKKAKEQGEETLGLLKKCVNEGINDGSIRSELDTEITSIMLYGMSKGVIQIMNEVIPETGMPLIQDKKLFIESFFEFAGYGLNNQK